MNIYIDICNEILKQKEGKYKRWPLTRVPAYVKNKDIIDSYPYIDKFPLKTSTFHYIMLAEQFGFNYCFLICPYCDKAFMSLSSHSKQAHKKPLLTNSIKVSKYWSETNAANMFKPGSDNPAFKHGGRLSPYSLNFKNYASKEEADIKIKQVKEKNRESQLAGASVRTLNYYINQGLNEEQAKKALSDSQRKFSLDICIEKYGQDIGTQVWQKRQKNWQNSVQANTNIDYINSMKGRTHSQHVAKFGLEKANRIKSDRISSVGFGKGSKESLRYFEPLKEWCMSVFDLEEKDICLGISSSKELMLNDNSKHYRYDFAIESLKIIIEYHGIAWHPKSEIDDWKSVRNSISSKDKWFQDRAKKLVAENYGYRYLEVWSDEEDILNKCKHHIAKVLYE